MKCLSLIFALTIILMVAVGGISSQTAQAETLVIDDFDYPAPGELFYLQGLTPGAANPIISQHDVTEVIGDQRDVLVEVLGPMNSISAGCLIGYDPDFEVGMFQLATYGASGTRAMLQYDGLDEETLEDVLVDAENMAIDLTDGGHNDLFTFSFETVDGVDSRGLDIDVLLTGTGGGTLSYSGFLADSAQPFSYDLPFNQFTQNGDASFGAISSITVTFNDDGTPNMDFALDSIVTRTTSLIPEPATLGLLGLGLSLIFAFPRRLRRA